MATAPRVYFCLVAEPAGLEAGLEAGLAVLGLAFAVEPASALELILALALELPLAAPLAAAPFPTVPTPYARVLRPSSAQLNPPRTWPRNVSSLHAGVSTPTHPLSFKCPREV